MKRIRLARFLGVVVAGWWISAATLPARMTTAHAQDSSTSDASPGDEGSEDLTSPDAGTASSRARPVSASGHWSGTISDNSLGAGTVDLLISQNKRKLSGGFDISAFQGTAEDLSGNLTGQASAGGIAFTLKPSRIKGCRINGTSTSFNGAEIKGSYSTIKCGSSLTSGSFDVNFEHP
jgi:hypothetical protein